MTEKSENAYVPTELRSSKVITNCSCVKANGLQDGCQRSKCKKNCEMAYRQMVPAEAFPNVKAHPEPARHRPVHHPEGANISNQKQDADQCGRTQHTPRSQFTLQDQQNARQYVVGDGQIMQQDNAIQRAQYEAMQNQGDLGQGHQKPTQEQPMHAPNELYSAHRPCCHCDFTQPSIKAYYVPQEHAIQHESQVQQYAASMQQQQQPRYVVQKQMPSTQYQQVAAPQHPATTMQMPQQAYGQAAAPQTVVVQLPQEQAQPQAIRVQMPQQAMQEFRQQEQNPAIGHHQHNQFQQVAGQQQVQYQQAAADQQQIPFQHVVCQQQQQHTPFQQTVGQHPAAIQAGGQQVPFQQAGGQQQVAYNQVGGQQVPFQVGGQQQVPFEQAQQDVGGHQLIAGQQVQQQIPLQHVQQTAIDEQGQQNSWGMNAQENMQQPIMSQQMS